MPVAMPSLLQNVLEHPRAAYPLPPLVLFAEAEERGCVSFSLSVCFSMIQYSKEKTPMKSPLRLTEDYSDQCYITMTQLKPRFHETLVLCNRISKIAYSSFKSYCCLSIPVFASLVSLPFGISSSAAEIKICAITA